MIRVYWTDRKNFNASDDFIRDVLRSAEGVSSPEIVRTKNGKPYLSDEKMHFSLSHTDELFFLAVYEREIGVDAEKQNRTSRFQKIAETYFPELTLSSEVAFLKAWTAKESAVKLIGGTLARDAKKLRLGENQAVHEESERPIFYQTFEKAGHFISLSSFEPLPEVSWLPYLL